MSTPTARDARLECFRKKCEAVFPEEARQDDKPDGAAPAAPLLAALAAMPVWLMALIAVAALAALDLAVDASRIVKALGDTDDATRLVQVRGLLAGAPWFDMTLPAIGAPEPLVSHWSRLIDLPLALMIAALTPLVGANSAETATRFVWPLVLLLPLVVVLAGEAERQAGRRAAIFAVVLAITCLSGLMQFMPGRIDHHNAMVLGAVAGIVLLVQSLDDPRLGWWAGAALALGTAVGYEALALTIATLAIFGLYALITGHGLIAVFRAANAFAAGLAIALALTVPPARLLVSHCDALSVNLLALAAAAAAGLGLVATRGDGWPLLHRLAIPAALGVVGLALYGFAQPACLKGPFGELHPAIGAAWLDSVVEAKSVFWLLRANPAPAVVFLAFGALGAAAAWRTWVFERTDANLLRLATLGAAVMLAVWQVKLIPYASFLAVLPLARQLAAIDPDDRNQGAITGSAQRLIGLMLVNQFALVALLTPVANALPGGKPLAAWTQSMRGCIASQSFAPLADLPPGLVFANLDLGPYIAALTPSRVVAAPYHRIDKAIIATDRIFKAPPDDAAARLKAIGANYVAICPGLTAASDPGRTQGLLGALITGATPAFLEPMTLSGPTPIKVWRVK